MTLKIINLTLKIFLLATFFANKSMAKSTNSVADNYFANAKINSDLFVDLISHKNKNDLDNKREFNQTLVRARFINNLHLNQNLIVKSQILVNQFNRQQANQISFLDNEGLALQEINLNYEDKINNLTDYSFVLGKVNMDFGQGWAWNRGVWSDEISREYRQFEKIVVGSSISRGSKRDIGRYDLSFNFFKNDRKYLDNSIFAERISATKQDAIPGDENIFKSFNVNLKVDFDFSEKVHNQEELHYKFGYLKLAVNKRFSSVDKTNLKDQSSWLAGVDYKRSLNENISIDFLTEYVMVENFNGDVDISQRYFINNMIAKYNKNINITVSNSNKMQKKLNNYTAEQNLVELSTGYEFDKNNIFDSLLLQIGYKNFRNSVKSSASSFKEQRGLGALIRYSKNF